MKIAVMGAGGLGGYYGGKLAHAGEDVTFIARGAQLEALRTHGLRVEGARDAFALAEVPATDDPATLGTVELVLVTVKAYDLEGAARALQPVIGEGTVVIPLLNGVDSAEVIGGVVGMEHVMGGLAYVSSSVAEPGVIRQVSPFDRILFGEPGGGRSERGARIEATLRNAGIEATQAGNIRADLWSKYLFIDAASGVTALTRHTMGPVLQDAETRSLFLGCMLEVEALARRQDIPLAEGICEETLEFADGVPAHMKPSMLLDLELGRPLELQALNGTAARLGRELGVHTPVNHFIYAALKLDMHGRR